MEKLVSTENGKVDGMFCRYEECCTTEDICPNLQLDNCECLKEALKKLAEYQNAEEQGLLLRLPCKVEDTIYKIPSKVNYDLNVLNGYLSNNKVYEQTIYYIKMYNSNRYLLATCEGLDSVLSDDYQKTWFLTREEAEKALVELGNKTDF